MEPHKKTILIKMFGVITSAAICATGAFYYFNTDLLKAYAVLAFAFGMLIFGISVDYEGQPQ